MSRRSCGEILGPCSAVTWCRKLWACHSLRKVKIHMWRAFHRALAVKDNLRSRGISCPIVCPVCEEGTEDSTHALWLCAAARGVWISRSIWEVLCNFRGRPFDAFCLFISQQVNNECFELFCMLTWSLSYSRNQCIFNGKAYSTMEIIERAGIGNVYSDYNFCRKVDGSHGHGSPIVRHAWRPLEGDLVKINVDALVLSFVDYVRIGVVARDRAGIVLAAASTKFLGRFSPHMAECIAIREGTMLARNLGFEKWVVELDAINAVNVVHSPPVRALEAGLRDSSRSLED
ncbi:uncharacterized protein LOC112091171 [Morus notabilis]|uniref:uncharacterized protein LOC112091171 n=1 Tax=Morus notabilis TaxID=981085 RepID=UPI000CECFDD7|nr:uncharacterized protein LOC112091171 [Morus notabilis]